MKTQRGFTVLELLLTLGTLGILLAIMAPLSDSVFALRRANQAVEQETVNRRVASGILAWMDQRGQNNLPAPYSGDEYEDIVVDPASTDADALALVAQLGARGLSLPQIFSNSSIMNNARVYQRVANQSIVVPLYGQTGPSVTLRFDIGLLYNSQCRRDDTSCYPAPSGVAGFSPVATATNIASWETAEGDFGLYRFSTLDLQLARLETSRRRIDTIRDALRDYFNAQYLSGAPDPDINHYPAPSGGGAPNLSGASPGSNDGCRDGWYDLSDSSVDVLATVGLLAAEYGRNAWGGRIEYCRDFDPAGTSAEGTAPQSAALRINAAPSTGANPGAPGANVLFTI